MKRTLAAICLLVLSTALMAEDWMKRLPDDAPVCVVSIPGTHDTFTGHEFSGVYYGSLNLNSIVSATDVARTQELTFHEQWALGVRGFDFRPCVLSGDLRINHGIARTQVTFDNAMTWLTDSLKAHPTEFAVIHLRYESDGDYGSDDFETLLTEKLKNYADYLVDWRHDLTVEDMRGKAVILYRESWEDTPGGYMDNWKCDNSTWSDLTSGWIYGTASDCSEGPLYMQDISNTYTSYTPSDKVTVAKQLLDYTSKRLNYNYYSHVWVYNFQSAYSQMKTYSYVFGSVTVSTSDGYRDNASYTNKAVYDYLTAADYEPGPTGIVLMDYAGIETTNGYSTYGTQAVEAIIENNFKYLAERDLTNDLTAQLGAYDATHGTTGWTVSSGLVRNKGGQHWSDSPSDYYFEQSSSLWASATKWSEQMEQTLSLPNGVYKLTAAGRSSSGATCTIFAGDNSYTFAAQGDTGGTMDVDGTEWESLSAGIAAGATFANSNAGRGWQWGSVTATVRDGQLTVGATLSNTSGNAYQWVSVDDFRLEYLGEETNADALDALALIIDQANSVDLSANVGDGALQIPTSAAEALQTAIETAAAAATDDASISDLEAAAEALTRALEAYDNALLNDPADTTYNILMAVDGFKYEGYALTPISGQNTAQGGYAYRLAELCDTLPQAWTLTRLSQNLFNLSFTDTDGARHYLCLSSAYSGSSTSNLRATTDQSAALSVRINAATGADGKFELINTAAQNTLGTSGSTTVGTASAYALFRIEEALYPNPVSADEEEAEGETSEPEEEVADAIEAVTQAEEQAIYDLAGRRLSQPRTGINIIGGRKVVR